MVTDIDETLTIADEEWAMQLEDGTYDPRARADATELVDGYFERGYSIFYLTARAATRVLAGTGETAPDATDRWLTEHGFPRDPERTRLQLAPEPVTGEATQAYKREALLELEAEGVVLDWAYGNALTDIGAYADAGIPKAVTFVIGEHAGAEGTVAIEGEDFLVHVMEHLPGVESVCSAA